MTQVAALVFLGRIPVGFLGIHLVENVAHLVAPFDVVEHEEFVFRAKISGIRNPGRLQVGFSALGQRARVAFVSFAGCGFQYIAGDIDGGFVGKRVEYRSGGIQCHDHV